MNRPQLYLGIAFCALVVALLPGTVSMPAFFWIASPILIVASALLERTRRLPRISAGQPTAQSKRGVTNQTLQTSAH